MSQGSARPHKSNYRKQSGTDGRKHASGKPFLLFFILIFAAVAAAIALAGYKFAYDVCNDVAVDESDTTKYEITLESGQETEWKEQIYDFLTENGLIESLNIYKWREKLYSAEYTAGTYALRKSYTTEKIINLLSGYVYNTDGVLEE